MQSFHRVRHALIALGVSTCCAGAFGASHTVKFDALPQGQLPANFTSNGVDMIQTPYTDTVGNACAPTAFGVCILTTQSFAPCPNGSPPNQLVARSVLVDFDMTDYAGILGGPVKKIVFRYLRMTGNVQIVFNGMCFTRPTFGGLANGTYGGVNYNDNGCRVRLKSNPALITQFSVGGALLAIDNVKAAN
ncbi:MAG: hypothetical protein IT449_10905 [Phycisphaerales bacterium]|nr:hypothetical protein [Phycisphaerales bacterium]